MKPDSSHDHLCRLPGGHCDTFLTIKLSVKLRFWNGKIGFSLCWGNILSNFPQSNLTSTSWGQKKSGSGYSLERSPPPLCLPVFIVQFLCIALLKRKVSYTDCWTLGQFFFLNMLNLHTKELHIKWRLTMAAAMTGGAPKRPLSDGGGEEEECNRQIGGALWTAQTETGFLCLTTGAR